MLGRFIGDSWARLETVWNRRAYFIGDACHVGMRPALNLEASSARGECCTFQMSADATTRLDRLTVPFHYGDSAFPSCTQPSRITTPRFTLFLSRNLNFLYLFCVCVAVIIAFQRDDFMWKKKKKIFLVPLTEECIALRILRLKTGFTYISTKFILLSIYRTVFQEKERNCFLWKFPQTVQFFVIFFFRSVTV